MSALTVIVVTLMAIAKIAMFAIAVRNALKPRPLPTQSRPIDPDGPDDGWRWWEEFDPQPDPKPEPADGLPVTAARPTL